ncbi:MAG: UPF0280 family protein [Rhizobiales bacterium]|nr:UPF0280 family protein [Hyphomicrobiales bacterium]
MTRSLARMLPDGRRLHLHDGPIDLVIGADGPLREVARAHDAARVRFSTILDELCAELGLLRQPSSVKPQGAVARRMWRATIVHAERNFITPMAAVAGAVAEEVLAAMVAAANLERAYINNGGDIALHLSPSREFQIGLIDRPDSPSLFAKTRIRWSDPVRGIATSGWRGRSFSLGIADAVTVLASTASTADAAATVIANAVDLPGHPAVTRTPAVEIQPDNDLGSRLVTRGVGALSPTEIAKALDRGASTAQALIDNGTIAACALHLAGATRTMGNALGDVGRLALHA